MSNISLKILYDISEMILRKYSIYCDKEDIIMKKFICRECGYIGRKKSIRPGSSIIELILILTAVIPGIFYQLLRNAGKKEVCPQCNSQNMVPIDSPCGKKVIQEFNFSVNINANNEIKTKTKKEVSINSEVNNVRLILVKAGKEKISVIREIRMITGIGLKEAKDLSDNVPSIIKESISIKEAKQIIKKFKELGAEVELH